jgi:hypothetical protein
MFKRTKTFRRVKLLMFKHIAKREEFWAAIAKCFSVTLAG